MNRNLLLVLIAPVLVMGGLIPLHGATTTASTGYIHADVIVTASTSTTVNFSNGNSIISGFLSPVLGFFQSILNGFSNLLNIILSGVGSSIAQIFSNWGYSVSGQSGIFAPIVMVAILGSAGAVVYLFLGFYGGEKDIVSTEEEI